MPVSLLRSAGVLLHPSSLPGPFGIGDLGPAAFRWIETLAAAQQGWWQILPLGPTGSGDSPYQSFSAFAGNINLLSPELLERDGLVSARFWAGQSFAEGTVDYAQVIPFKDALLREAWANFRGGAAAQLQEEFAAFCQREAGWLDGFARFMAIRESLGGAGLAQWPEPLCRRDPTAIATVDTELADSILRLKFGQYLFDRQWSALKAFAHDTGIRIMGDVPIFVAADSADVWANPKQFLVDATCTPQVVAGVPPDYFSADGQHWGNPLYDWEAMAADGYAWWVARVRQCLKQVDLVRLDHFRGFAQAWHIPAGETTARNGQWVDGPGRALFDRLREALGGLPFVAEDLGLITPDVHALRESLGLPGMRVLQFALGGPTNPYLPHNYEPNTVVYTGTHDNDTTNGWFATLSKDERRYLAEYVGHAFGDPAWELIRLAWSSVGVLAIAPLQDVLSLGHEARMNIPGRPEGNWRWRLRPGDVKREPIERLAEMTARYNRVPEKQQP
jgi:4-alpha-glucanotransferase